MAHISERKKTGKESRPKGGIELHLGCEKKQRQRSYEED